MPALGFIFPGVLLALLGLPLLWWLLRATPPRPREMTFPPLKLILDLQARRQTPLHTPWWLLALRLAVAGLAIIAMAGPQLNPPPATTTARGPLLVLIDSGWPAATDWERRIATATALLRSAALAGRPAAFSDFEAARLPQLAPAARVLGAVQALEPVPYAPDHRALLPALRRFLAASPASEVVWIADGTALGHADSFARALAGMTKPHVMVTGHEPRGLAGASNGPDGLSASIIGMPADKGRGVVVARDAKGRQLAKAAFSLSAGSPARATFDLPLELRNEVARIDIAGEASAGAVHLTDGRLARRRVGIVNGEASDVSEPLLSPSYFLRRALAPFAEVRESHGLDPIADLLAQKVTMLVLADVGQTSPGDHAALQAFVRKGGVLVRFAGLNMAGSSDDLLPVRIRTGDRVLGAALSWERPKHIAAPAPQSPLAGLKVGADIVVRRQVLAEPEPGLTARTWVSLKDGTPLVTAARRGNGELILVHVSADPSWSNLPLSAFFVDMLRRFTGLAAASGADATPVNGPPSLQPRLTLDGFGALGLPPATARPIPAKGTTLADATHPPGLYGPQGSDVALNALGKDAQIRPLDFAAAGLRPEHFMLTPPVDLRPLALLAALLMFLADALATLWLAGGLGRRQARQGAAAMVALVALGLTLSLAAPGHGKGISQKDLDSALNTRLAYVITGSAKIDRTSRLGLKALSRELDERTALDPGTPVGLNPASDDLSFYPLLYWPIRAQAPQPSAATVLRIAAYMKHGGTIVFDTRDALYARPGGPPTPQALWLRHLLSGVDVPPLEQVPADHVVTKTFFLINRFVGRYANGATWIEALPPPTGKRVDRPARAGDGVSPLIITSNDLAGAWAMDSNDEPLYPTVPGGDNQREMAFRGGINLVMYTLTGNYKADQVHVHDLLQRLSH
ncbi:MAG: DUF4159 domain-containing protein [Hyphomicrobiales bacterium]|nr:DUF4159 domain-containing protein [Hyphomicrobiales bacterium]